MAAANNEGKLEGKQCTKPVCIITLGMAGSGKTTFVQVVLSCS
jgi:tRNA A37 threonylcarbamoyladenosine biosynthesis protein TsaE